MNKRVYLILSLLVTLITAYPSYAAVKVKLNGTPYLFDTAPRLSDVLAPVAFQKQWYWPATKLFKQSSVDVDKQRSRLLGLLATQGRENDQHKSTFQSIINQLKSWKLADRIMMQVDFEWARYSLPNNPRFTPGAFHLLLSERPTHLYVFGAVQTPKRIDYQNNTCIEHIVENIESAPFADRSYVYLISPQGKVQKAPVAYWNRQCVIPMPGSMLYVPLQEHTLFSTISDINKDIATLAANRIEQQ